MKPRARQVLSILLAGCVPPVPSPGSSPFHERSQTPVRAPGALHATHADQTRTLFFDGTVRAVVSTPSDFRPDRPTLLLLFAVPNGNTIEQTMGCRAAPGLDWHFEIQHVAAQARQLRELDTARNIVIAYFEAEGLSWPAWRGKRPDAPKRIAGMVADVLATIPGERKSVCLACHSGGGAFLFSFIDAANVIPATVERIVFLDANYSYDDAKDHGGKLIEWLRGDAKRHLVVIAYDDRDVMLNGKKIVSETGGTWRASMRMIERMGKDVQLEKSNLPLPVLRGRAGVGVPAAGTGVCESPANCAEPPPQPSPGDLRSAVPGEGAIRDVPENASILRYEGLAGQIRFLLHPNPEKKILHTRLVELNGLLEATTTGTPAAGKWNGVFFGARAYEGLIPPLPATPDRRPGALGGKALVEKWATLTPSQRESAVAAEMLRGNFPPFLRRMKTVRLTSEIDGKRHECLIEVAPDYVAVGSDEDFLRIPLTPTTAMKIATQLGCTLPTRRMVDAVDAAADVRLEPKPLTKDRESFATFVQHHQIIEGQRTGKPLGGLICGIKKDVVLTNRLAEKPGKVAIYGWRLLDGKPIQPLTTVHKESYVDYSHGVRLVRRLVKVDGQERLIEDVLKDPKLHVLLSDEGPVAESAAFYRMPQK